MIPITITNRTGTQGVRSFLVKIAVLRYGTAMLPTARITITDSTTPAPTPAPTPTNTWVSAPLRDGGWARVKSNDTLWDITGPGAGRPLKAGEIVAVYFNGWGNQANGQDSYAIYTLSDGTSGRALAIDLEGVAPSGTPPGLPADWWVPGLVTAAKTCSSAINSSQPGVVAGGVYRASMQAGSHIALTSGQVGLSSNLWNVYATGDLEFKTRGVVVTGDCLKGL
jgi:hypothetical protein